ncbi:glycosyltransferase family 2 protein [Frateuria sp.]|uniref:glycosyltransferase family 2 protein n=1 Tax=Frateuria sp. TaxID=2211372 RepID=UPI0017A34D6F|nr:glycosyltransferase family 2 protein [Frateuria sp.]NUR22995.1 glycosyltransferase family 2 protein [Frateuria sp.]
MNLGVVIPAYRSEHWVARTIRSVLAEGVPARNVLVVEDGVFDATSRVVRETGAQLISLPQNGGAPHARNLGLAQLDTRYVMFLDADDYVENGLLAGLVGALERNAADVAIGPWRYHGEGRERGVLRQPPELDNGERIFHWIIHAFFPPCCIAWRTEAVRAIGGWDERLRKDQDGELMIRALTGGLKVAVSAQGNGVYWQHDSPHRVTRAQIRDVMYAADIVFEQLERWVRGQDGRDGSNPYALALGRVCCKNAWVAFANGEDALGARWSARARSFGLDSKGYNARSALLARFLGIRISSRIKARTGAMYRRVAQR